MAIKRKRLRVADRWPIDPSAGQAPQGWGGWPDGKEFAFVLTHDVDTAKGAARCLELAGIEERLGFRSSFNFVPERYETPEASRRALEERGFEVGVHGLLHDGKLYSSRQVFRERAQRINGYLKSWNAVGFRSPAMHSRLEWLHDLDIEYDASTFDTDPFEPQPRGAETIFPFVCRGPDGRAGFVELPYTLCQDFTLFVLLGEKRLDVWKRKLDWVVEKGGMALLNVHPDYTAMAKEKPSFQEYPARLYEEFLDLAQREYEGRYWHGLPRDLARFVRQREETLNGVK